jgi:hypothetical protein
MPKLKLTYFDFHGGRGKPARLALSIGGISLNGSMSASPLRVPAFTQFS